MTRACIVALTLVACGGDDDTHRWQANGSTSYTFGGTIGALLRAGDDAHVFATDSQAGLVVVDIRDPDAPVRIGTLAPAALGATPFSLALSADGETLYAGASDNKVHVIDVRDLAAPVARGAVQFSPCYSILALGTMVYCGGGNAAMRSIDASDPDAPVLTTRDYRGRPARAFTTDGTHVITNGTADNDENVLAGEIDVWNDGPSPRLAQQLRDVHDLTAVVEDADGTTVLAESDTGVLPIELADLANPVRGTVGTTHYVDGAAYALLRFGAVAIEIGGSSLYLSDLHADHTTALAASFDVAGATGAITGVVLDDARSALYVAQGNLYVVRPR